MANTIATKTKAAIGSLLAGSILLTAVPATAQHRGDRYDRRGDGISAGEVIAGAVVIGGLAAILSSGNNRGGRNDDRYYDRGGDRYQDGYNGGYDWQRQGGSRSAIERCVAAVESRGNRRNDIDVTRVTDVERIRGGYRIEGNVAVDYRNRGGNGGGDWRANNGRWDDRNDRDGRGDGYDRGDRYGRDGRGYTNRGRYDDRGSFACTVRYGQVDNVNVRGI